jgi:hypothetical protein
VINILIRSRDPEIMRSLSQIPPAKVLKLTVPHRGMNENSDAPIVQPKSGDHQMLSRTMDYALIELSTESIYNCIMIVNVMKRFFEYIFGPNLFTLSDQVIIHILKGG